MKFDRKYRPELVASSGETRFYLTHVHLDTEAKCMVATDGHMLVKVPVTIEPHDDAGFVTTESLKAARKASGKSRDPQIECNGSLLVHGVGKLDRPSQNDGTFPPWRQVMPSYRRGDDETVTISLNADYLASLAKALGSTGVVELTIRPAPKTARKDGVVSTLDPIVVTAREKRGETTLAIGVLMPCAIGDA